MMGQVVTLARPHGPLSQAPIPLTERMAEDEGARMMAGAPTSAEIIAFPTRRKVNDDLTPPDAETLDRMMKGVRWVGYTPRFARNAENANPLRLTGQAHADMIARAEKLIAESARRDAEMEAARLALATPHLRREVE